MPDAPALSPHVYVGPPGHFADLPDGSRLPLDPGVTVVDITAGEGAESDNWKPVGKPRTARKPRKPRAKSAKAKAAAEAPAPAETTDTADTDTGGGE